MVRIEQLLTGHLLTGPGVVIARIRNDLGPGRGRRRPIATVAFPPA